MPHTLHVHHAPVAAGDAPGPATYAAFVVSAVLAGGNAVAVRIGNFELAPFWGASIRFVVAGVTLLALAGALRLTIPRGRALAGVLLYGFFSFAAAYMFLYFALTEMTGGSVMVAVALAPLLTLLIAAAIGLEKLTGLAITGAVTAVIGVGVVFSGSLGVASPITMAAAVGGAASIAIAPIIIKRFPRVHAVMENAIAMAFGGILLLALSLVVGEPKVIPIETATQLSLLYLILLGSIGLCLLYLFVLRTMPASAATYLLLLAPLSAAGIEAMLLGETVGPAFFTGGLLVLVGVYVGVIRRAQAT
jgi:drug/metabolite transporter (DMT)-like permease